jgi:hypothetical protein
MYYINNNPDSEDFHYLLVVVHRLDVFDDLPIGMSDRRALRDLYHQNPAVGKNYERIREEDQAFFDGIRRALSASNEGGRDEERGLSEDQGANGAMP